MPAAEKKPFVCTVAPLPRCPVAPFARRCLGVKIKKKLHIYPTLPALSQHPADCLPLSVFLFLCLCGVLPLPLPLTACNAVWGQLSCKLPSAFRVSSFVYAELNKFP